MVPILAESIEEGTKKPNYELNSLLIRLTSEAPLCLFNNVLDLHVHPPIRAVPHIGRFTSFLKCILLLLCLLHCGIYTTNLQVQCPDGKGYSAGRMAQGLYMRSLLRMQSL